MKVLLHALVVAAVWLPQVAHGAPPPPPPPPGDDTSDAIDPGEDDDTLIIDEDPVAEPEPTGETDPNLRTDAAAASDAIDDSETDRPTADRSETPDVDDPNEKAGTRHPFRTRYLTIEGYLQPQYRFSQRSGARARFAREFGAEDTRAGIKFFGEPLDRWSYRIHIVVGGLLAARIVGIDVIDYEGDGSVDDVVAGQEFTAGLGIEELWINYEPVRFAPRDMQIIGFSVKAGQMRAPVTRQNAIQNDSLLFPRRNAVSGVFTSDRVGGTTLAPDVGALGTLALVDRRIRVAGGIFNGTGLGIDRVRTRGPFYVSRIDIEPLGEFAKSEAELQRPEKRFLFGVGGSFSYRPYRVFDQVGNDTLTRVRDAYGNASAYMALYGLLLQGEFLRRQTTDNLSSRPVINTGAYGQASYVFQLPKNLFLVPMGNFSWMLVDEASNPQRRMFTQDGVALYLGNEVRDDAVRVSIMYVGEWRRDEQETAHGGLVQLQLKF